MDWYPRSYHTRMISSHTTQIPYFWQIGSSKVLWLSPLFPQTAHRAKPFDQYGLAYNQRAHLAFFKMSLWIRTPLWTTRPQTPWVTFPVPSPWVNSANLECWSLGVVFYLRMVLQVSAACHSCRSNILTLVRPSKDLVPLRVRRKYHRPLSSAPLMILALIHSLELPGDAITSHFQC